MRKGAGTCNNCRDIPVYADDLCVFCWSYRNGWNAALDAVEQGIRTHYKTTPPLSVQRILAAMDYARKADE